MSCTCALDCAAVLNPSLRRGCGNNDKQTGGGEERGQGGVEKKKKKQQQDIRGALSSVANRKRAMRRLEFFWDCKKIDIHGTHVHL